MLQRALFSRGAARTVEASPVEEAYAWGAYVTLAAKTNHPELRLALAGLRPRLIRASGL